MIFTIVTIIITIVTSGLFLLVLVVVVFNTTFLSEVVKFGSVLRVSVELDVLAGRVEEVEALGVGEVDTVQDGDEEEDDDDDENVQPCEVGFDLANAVFSRSHFFGRSLTARGTGPAARVGGFAATAATLGGLGGALSGRAVTFGGATRGGGGEVVAVLVGVASVLLGVVALGLHAAGALLGEAGRIPQALVEAFSGGDVDVARAADPQAHFLLNVPVAGSELTAGGGVIADAFRGFALDVGGVPDAFGVEPAGRLSGVTTETFNADTLRSVVGGVPTAERVGRARGSGGVDGAARGNASTLLVSTDGSTRFRDEEIVPCAARDFSA